jgi:hypothetical protein
VFVFGLTWPHQVSRCLLVLASADIPRGFVGQPAVLLVPKSDTPLSNVPCYSAPDVPRQIMKTLCEWYLNMFTPHAASLTRLRLLRRTQCRASMGQRVRPVCCFDPRRPWRCGSATSRKRTCSCLTGSHKHNHSNCCDTAPQAPQYPSYERVMLPAS